LFKPPVQTPSRGEFGPDIGFRESSFLQHEALPDIVRASVVHVLPCRRGEVGCASGDNPATLEFNRLFMERGMASDRIVMCVAWRGRPPLL
jgi:hypothetical protein